MIDYLNLLHLIKKMYLKYLNFVFFLIIDNLKFYNKTSYLFFWLLKPFTIIKIIFNSIIYKNNLLNNKF